MALTDSLQNTTNFAEAMKIYYAAKAVQTLTREVVLLGELEKTKEYWTGRHHQVPVHMRSAEAVGARAEEGNLPSARALTYAESKVFNKSLYCSVKVTGQAEAQTRDQAGAWASVKEDQIRNAVQDLRYDLGRQAYGDGKGILCEIKAGGATAVGQVVTCTLHSTDNGDGAVTNDTGWAWNTTKVLRVGMYVAWGRYDGGAGFAASPPAAVGYGYISEVTDASPYNAFKITAITTLDGATTPAGGMVLVRGDGVAAADNSFDNEVMGITGMISASTDDGTNFQNVSLTAYPEWKAQVLSNGGTKRPLDEVLFQQALNRISDRTNGNTEFTVAHTSVRDSFLFHIKSLGRERYAPQKLLAGWSVLEYNGGSKPVRVYADRQARHGRLWGIDKSSMKCFVVKAFAWDESNGAVWKWEKGKDALIAFAKIYKNFGVVDRKRNFVIEDIAVDEGSLYE